MVGNKSRITLVVVRLCYVCRTVIDSSSAWCIDIAFPWL